MRKSILFGFVGLMAAGFAACSNDSLNADGPSSGVLEEDQSFWVNISVNTTGNLSDGITRAGGLLDQDYEDYDGTEEPNYSSGEDYENKVNSIYLVFYDKNRQRVSTVQVMKDINNSTGSGFTANDENSGFNGTDVTGNNSINKIYSGVVQVDVKHGNEPPSYVIAFINPITVQNFEFNQDFDTLDQVEQSTRPQIIDGNGNFAMSKSFFYGVDFVKHPEATGTETQYFEPITATPIKEGQLFKTIEEAKEALSSAGTDFDEDSDASVVDIYVERYAAKVNFELQEQTLAKTYELKIGESTLTFVPEYWAVNAFETETYVTKSFFQAASGGVGSTWFDYTTINNNITGNSTTGWTYWNNPEAHRCYWGQSPGYYAANYPRVADDIMDNWESDDIKGRDADDYDRMGGFTNGYYSYNNLVKNATGKLADKARSLKEDAPTTYKAIYVRENTIAGQTLIDAYNNPNASPKAAVGSIVLVGHYKLDGQDVDDTFYVTGNATNGYKLFKTEEEMLKNFLWTGVKLAKDQNGTYFFDYDNGDFVVDADADNYKALFTVKHPDKNVRGVGSDNEVIVDSRYVACQLTDKVLEDEASPVYIYKNNKWTKIETEQDLIYANQQLMYTAGMAQGYEGGKAYFTIPIQHLGYYRQDNANKNTNANAKDFDWTKVHTGDFGIVRNHVYTISVSDIKGLGNGIPDPDDPIVPPTDPEEYYIGARIIVLNWAMVPKQVVEL